MVQQVAVVTLYGKDKQKTELVSHWLPWSWIYKEELADAKMATYFLITCPDKLKSDWFLQKLLSDA